MKKSVSSLFPNDGVFLFGEHKAYLKLPVNYDQSKEYPLILFFHGRGGSAERNNFTSADFALFREKISQAGFVIAAPEYGADSWFNEKAEKISLEILDFLYGRLSLCHDYYVMGCSMGGAAALTFTARHPERVRGLCDIFGVTDFVRFYEDGHYQKSISDAYGGTASEKVDFYKSRSAVNHIDVLKKIPLFVMHGDKDRTVPEWNSGSLVKALSDAGGNVEYIIVPGLAHSNSIINGFEDKIISFFKSN